MKYIVKGGVINRNKDPLFWACIKTGHNYKFITFNMTNVHEIPLDQRCRRNAVRKAREYKKMLQIEPELGARIMNPENHKLENMTQLEDLE